jgi:energy-coupling factor transport system ATP-binding protein
LATAVELKRVGYAYPGCGPVLNGLDLALRTGQATVVFGAGGSGKSTLAYLLNGLIPHFFGGRLEGTVTVKGIDTRQASVTDLFSDVGLVLQNADAQLFNSTVAAELAFGLESMGLGTEEIGVRIRRTAADMGITHLLPRSPETLSGGEKRAVAIAAVLISDPEVVVLDEPFTGLDWNCTRVVGSLLKRIAQGGRTLLLIEHRVRPFLNEADRCLVIEGGRIEFDGTPATAAAVLAERHLVPQYAARTSAERQIDPEALLAVRRLTCRLEGSVVLDDVSLEIRSGQPLAIVGENGSGKTTLVKHCSGLLAPHSGEVLFKGKSIGSCTPPQRVARVGLCFQNPNDQFFKGDVHSELLAGVPSPAAADATWQQRILDALKLTPLLDRSPHRLSEGEKRRVALASVLLMRPAVLILDEPTAGLDGCMKEMLAGLLAQIVPMGVTPVVVTHDLDFAEATTDRWIWLQRGKIRSDGNPGCVRRQINAAEGINRRSG